MSRQAVEEEFDEFLDEMLEYIRDEFSPTRAFMGVRGVGDSMLRDAFSDTMDDELREIRSEMKRQLDVVMEYVEDENPDQNAYYQEFLRSNPLYTNFDGRVYREKELKRDLREHLDEVAEQLEPLVRYEEDEDETMYDALCASYDREEAEEIIDWYFNQADRFREYRDSMDVTVEVGSSLFSTEIDVTDEVIRLVDEGEEYVKQNLLQERLEEAYGSEEV